MCLVLSPGQHQVTASGSHTAAPSTSSTRRLEVGGSPPDWPYHAGGLFSVLIPPPAYPQWHRGLMSQTLKKSNMPVMGDDTGLKLTSAEGSSPTAETLPLS